MSVLKVFVPSASWQMVIKRCIKGAGISGGTGMRQIDHWLSGKSGKFHSASSDSEGIWDRS